MVNTIPIAQPDTHTEGLHFVRPSRLTVCKITQNISKGHSKPPEATKRKKSTFIVTEQTP